MKVLILAGGRGTRFGSETLTCPKPLISVDGKPVILRVMEIYARQGFKDFVIATGYRGDQLKCYFHQLMLLDGDLSPEFCNRERYSDWNVTMVETGLDTATGTRIGKVGPYVDGETFMLTWCDGLADVDLKLALEFHEAHGRLATVTAVNHRDRFGLLNIENDRVVEFEEKPLRRDKWINGAFFILQRDIMDQLQGEEIDWETDVLASLAMQGGLMAFKHHGLWQCMDTPQDRDVLEAAINSGQLLGGDAL